MRGSSPSEKKRAGHEPSVNVIREAGGIFAPISVPVECCDDEATREDEEFCELDPTAGKEKGSRKLTRKTSELSTMGVVARDEATVEPSSRDHTCRTCPRNGQVQNVGSESSDLLTIRTDWNLAKPPDQYRTAGTPALVHGIGTESIFASASSRSLQQSGSTTAAHSAVCLGARGLFWLMHVRRGSLIIHERQLGKLEQASCETANTPVRGTTTSTVRGVDLTTVRLMFAGDKHLDPADHEC